MIVVDSLQRWATTAAVVAALSGVTFGLGYYRGDQARNDAWIVKQAKAERQVRDKHDAELAKGREAAAELAAQLQSKGNQYAELQKLHADVIRQHRLTVQRSVSRVAAADARGSTAPIASRAHAAAAPGCVALSEAVPDAAGGAAEPGLSLAAVWMWNSALDGAADRPAGACRVDAQTGQADPACAADSGLDLADAWTNHRINAQSCTEDRLRHERLIDFLEQREKRASPRK